MTTKSRYISIRLIASVVAVALIAAAVLSMGAVSERNTTRTLTEEIHTRMLLMARNLALLSADAILEDYPELVLLPMIKDLLRERPELSYAIVIDASGTVRAHPDPTHVGRRYERPQDLEPTRSSLVLQPGENLLHSPELLVAATPIHVKGGEPAGQTILALRDDYLRQRVSAARRAQFITVALLLAAGIGVALVTVSFMMRPLGVMRQALERIGRGDLNTRVEAQHNTELGLLAETINDMASQLKAAQGELVEKERLNHEMELAKTIQESLRPPAQTVTDSFVVCASQRSAAEVGGDFFDVFRLPDGRLSIAIADVAGKGLAGCLATSMLAALVRAFRTLFDTPGQMLASLDVQLQASLPMGTFVTMSYGLLEPDTGRFVFASAGHNPGLVYRGATQSIEWHHPRGRPLAALRKPSRRSHSVAELNLGPHDMLVQFTDGLSEAWRNGQASTLFGLERIADVVREAAPRGAAAVVRRLEKTLDEWTGEHPRADDETLLVISRERSSAPRGNASEPDTTAAPVSESQAEIPSTLARVDVEALCATLENSRTAGLHLQLTGRPSVEPLRDWLSQRPELRQLRSDVYHLMLNGLYELWANLLEHGVGEEEAPIALFWLSDCVTTLLAETETRPVSFFVMCDQTQPFAPAIPQMSLTRSDVIRRRGRGLGLHIVHRATSEVHYVPATRLGNLTLLRFDPEEMVHALGG